MDASPAYLRGKTRVATSVVVLANVSGNFLLSWGLKGRGALLSLSPAPYLEALLNPWAALGVTLLVVWLLARMALLSWADLSYVLPVTAVGYVLNTVAGKVLLLEHVSWERWAGTFLITAGVVMVGGTPPRTTAAGDGGK